MTSKSIKLLAMVAALSAVLPVWAQTEAKIVGMVKDQDGNAVAGAAVSAVGQKSSEKRSLKTEGDGSFVLPKMPPDTYQITATSSSGNDASSIIDVGAGQTR